MRIERFVNKITRKKLNFDSMRAENVTSTISTN